MGLEAIDKVEYEISWIEGEDIAVEVERYKQLFARVREYAGNDQLAWLVAQDLNQVLGKVRNMDFDEKDKSAKLGQLVKLKALGISELSHLTEQQISALIESINAKKSK